MTNIKISHNRRVFLMKEEEKNKLRKEDIETALKKFKLMKNIKKKITLM